MRWKFQLLVPPPHNTLVFLLNCWKNSNFLCQTTSYNMVTDNVHVSRNNPIALLNAKDKSLLSDDVWSERREMPARMKIFQD
ncbi:unnamed protein product [Hymenolepis diminuta]|uniref:Uncharacterized protein n=1 Tax=Hymenolepis diminuta TaxID=6216 RepID=A0A564ZEA4_HYMDI|nr:unnamed protein product [Hymenolepis diminuta]